MAADAATADAAGVVEVPPPRGKVLSLVYSAGVGGEYERCDCAVAPLGGFARRASEVDRVRAESDGVIQVDAGDLFLPDGVERERRARLVAAACARLGVAAFTPGERDLALGLPLLRRVLAEAKVPVVSANLADARGRLLFDADRLVETAGVKVGIFGVTALSRRASGVVARDSLEAARAEVASLRARGAKIVVALVHLGSEADTKALLERTPGIDWAVPGHESRKLETPERVDVAGGSVVRELEAMSQGQFLGRLDLHVVSGDGAGPWADRDARATLGARLASHERQIADLQSRGQSPGVDERQRRLLDSLRERVAEEARDLHALPARIEGNWFENRVVTLDTAVPDQPGMAALVAAYGAEGGRPARVGPVAGGKPAATVLGNASCARCHAPELAFWRGTKHAGAFAALEKARSARSLACVGCHVTGFAQPGGSMDVAVLATRLRDVGCEACHGPGSAHVDAPRERGLVARTPSAAVCFGCHTPDRTPSPFDLAALTRAVVGPGHGAPAP